MSNDNHICSHCRHYAPADSKCGITRDTVGYFARACDKFEDNVFFEHADQPKPQMQTCKICGRTLPLDDFPKHPRPATGNTTICRDCFRIKNAASIKKAAASSAISRKGTKRGPYKPRVKTEAPAAIVTGLNAYTDDQLFNELLARGYKGTLTRVIELSAPDQK